MTEPSGKISNSEIRQLFHDLNNKIGFIELSLDLMEDDATVGDEIRNQVKTARTAVQEVKSLLNALSNAVKTHRSEEPPKPG